MSAKIKVDEKEEKEIKGTKVSFDKVSEYKAIKLKSDGVTYVEHKVLADKLISKKLAEEVKGVEIEVSESNTQILKGDKK
ncbi:hypothetical protein SAMN05421866_0047 [Chryseobacterium oranimense]|uniref:Uncharacterized protein n=1 Tax=Chryseobacterium oranimense TaxID=421058 RepID=A0A1M5X847_9FLAO|nr:hypothetical protein [Chryseobacterium oranimense]SHH96005.1 hypothetical protein SAMN05421866_0047 [Chryseobacterium oranimense]